MASNNSQISRREFLGKTTQLAAGAIGISMLASCARPTAISTKSRVLGANDRINLAIIGVRGRGMNQAEGFAKIPNVRIKTLCDIDTNLFAERVKKIDGIQHFAPATEKDLRWVFEDKDIDAVTVALPNHWHALAMIWACQASKHVFVEKPCSHNIREGRRMVEAASKYGRIVQCGFQNRSLSNVQQAIKFLHDGGIGEVYMARGLCFKARDPIGKVPDGIGTGPQYKYSVWNNPGVNFDADYMSRVDYDMWLGPAPQRPFNYNRFHYNWHWNWDYGNGDIGNQGPHQFDIARWGLNKNEHPVKVSSLGGYFGPESDQQTPNTQSAVFEYADGKIMQFDVRGIYTNDEAAMFTTVEKSVADTDPNAAPKIVKELIKIQDGVGVGNLFYGTKGWMYLNDTVWKTYFGRKNEPGPCSQVLEESANPNDPAGAGSQGHFVNFITALRSGKKEDINCNIEEGFMSTTLPHLANISYRLGRTIVFNGKNEKFVSDGQADKMLTRNYRRPYAVPDRV
ncbi:MAG: Gfo/Idh/MocA family oxidoreductase [Sedimentisphaerales bacterium]|jgi:predicted dehydrogenase